jgi:hypothetical protein
VSDFILNSSYFFLPTHLFVTNFLIIITFYHLIDFIFTIFINSNLHSWCNLIFYYYCLIFYLFLTYSSFFYFLMHWAPSPIYYHIIFLYLMCRGQAGQLKREWVALFLHVLLLNSFLAINVWLGFQFFII